MGVVMFQSLLAKLSGSQDGHTCWQLIEQGAKVIDVRSPEEFNSGHLPGAINIPLANLESGLTQVTDKQASIVLYCGAGIRAQKGCDILKAQGFNCAINGGSLKDLLCCQPI